MSLLVKGKDLSEREGRRLKAESTLLVGFILFQAYWIRGVMK